MVLSVNKKKLCYIFLGDFKYQRASKLHYQMGGFCLLVELHREGSVPAACAGGLFFNKHPHPHLFSPHIKKTLNFAELFFVFVLLFASEEKVIVSSMQDFVQFTSNRMTFTPAPTPAEATRNNHSFKGRLHMTVHLLFSKFSNWAPPPQCFSSTS